MEKFKVLKPFFKLSENKNYKVGDTIELKKEDSEPLFLEGYIENLSSYEDSEEGTKGIVTRKTPEQADKEIKKLNKKLKDA